MPLFSYKARDRNGKSVKGELYADTEKSLFSSLKESGLFLVSCSEVKEKKSSIWEKRVFEKVKRKDLIDFSSNLATILSSGIPILSGLQELKTMTKRPIVKDCIAKIAGDITSGMMLSEAMKRQPEVFSEAYINAIKAGELSGNMDEVLREIVAFLKWQDKMEEDTKKLLTYPAIVFSAITVLLFIVIGFVLPRLVPIFTSLNVKVPLPTRILLSIGLFIKGYWPFIILFVAVLTAVCIYYGRGKKRSLFIDRMLLKMPVIGGLIEKLAISRFVHNLKIMYQAGVDIGRSLEIAGKGVGNRVIRQVIKDTREEVMNGGSLSASLSKSRYIPPLTARMFSVGETSGKMDECLKNLTEYYDRVIPETIERIMRGLEPLMMIFLGVLVLIMAISVFVPLYKMMSGIK